MLARGHDPLPKVSGPGELELALLLEEHSRPDPLDPVAPQRCPHRPHGERSRRRDRVGQLVRNGQYRIVRLREPVAETQAR
jgi:hypothetical protein